MATHVYVVKNEMPLENEIRAFLLRVIPSYKRERILQNRCPKKAETMLVAGALLSVMLKSFFGISLEEQQFGKGDHGKPYLLHFPDVHFSVSHSGKWAACAVSDAPVGIDIQEIRPYVPTVAQKVCNMEELAEIEKSADAASAFTRLWTRKEAVLKKHGTGIFSGEIINCLVNEEVTSWQEKDYWVSISEKKGL